MGLLETAAGIGLTLGPLLGTGLFTLGGGGVKENRRFGFSLVFIV